MRIVKFFFPVVATTGLGGMVVFNRRILGNSEEVEVSEMSKGYDDVESSWGEKKDEKGIQVSFWKKGSEGYERSREGREETHKNIFIFDLCNDWIKFGGSNGDEGAKDYGYTWKDVCNIVRENTGNKEVGWLEFVTQLMNSNNVVQVKQDCCNQGERKICPKLELWEKGKWIKKCFEKELEVSGSKDDIKKKMCQNIWKNPEVISKNPKKKEDDCEEGDIGRKISEKLRISRSNFGDGGTGHENNSYWCNKDGDNGYKDGKEGGKITEKCRGILKTKIKDFVEKQKTERKRDIERQDQSIKENCMGIYDGQKFEVKCKDGWVIKSAKSY